MPNWTPFIVVAIPLLLGALDVFLYWTGGNSATISWVMLTRRASQPLVALSTCYSFGVLLGHFFLPQFTNTSPPAYLVIARMWFALSPTIYALIIIAFDNGTLEAHRKALQSGGQGLFALYMSLAFHAGGVVGCFVLAQHVPPHE